MFNRGRDLATGYPSKSNDVAAARADGCIGETGMGQAKQRGTFEERRASAVDRRARELALQQELMRRRPSPKHTKQMALLASMMAIAGGVK